MKLLVKRRKFLLGVGALLFAGFDVTDAAPLPRIVVLSPAAPEDQMRAFEEGLRARGLIHGSTVILTHLTGGGRSDALPRLAAEAVSLSPHVVVAVGAKAGKAAQESTRDIPIVVVTGDIVSAGLVKNLSHPEGNITGYSFFSLELATKKLELLLEVNPLLQHLKILMPSRMHSTQVQALSILNESLKGKEITAEILGVPPGDRLEALISSIPTSPEVSLLVLPSVMLDARAREIGGMIAKHRVMAMLPWKEYVEAGGLMSYSPDIVAIWREASTYVDRILRGAKPGDLPIIQPTMFELVINLRSAQDLGVHIPASMLLRADRIVE